MKYLLYLFFLLFVSFAAVAQSPEIKLDWLVTAPIYQNGGDITVNDIAVGSDGSTVVVGCFTNTVDFDPGPDTFNVHASYGLDIFIAKYGKAGKLIYAYNFGAIRNPMPEIAYGVALDDSGNAYMAGNFSSTIDFDPGSGTTVLTAVNTEAFVASYDKNGGFRYAIQVTNTGADRITQTAKSICVDKQHNVYVTGSFRSKADFDPGAKEAYLISAGNPDIFFAKYDKDGKYIWAKSAGGSDYDEPNKILLDRENNLVLCGYFSSSSADFDPGPDKVILSTNGREDIFFAKYDTSGNYIYVRQIGGKSYDFANSVAADADNSIVITGSFAGNNVDFNTGPGARLLSAENLIGDCFVTKYDRNGNFVSAFKIGGTMTTTITGNFGADIDVDSNHNIVVVGNFIGSTVDFDPGPNVYNITTTHDVDNFVAKYTPDGSLVFVDAVGNETDTSELRNPRTYIRSVQIDKENNIVTGGSFKDTLDIDPGANLKTIYEPATSLLLTKYNSNGAYINSINANNYIPFSETFSQVKASVTDEEGNTYLTGYFEGLIDFDPGPGVYLLQSLFHIYIYTTTYFAKYDKTGKLIFAKALDGATAFDIAIDKDQDVYLSGTAYNSTDFDPSDSVQYWNKGYSTSAASGIFFAKYSKTGDLVFAKGLLTSSYDVMAKIVTDKQKNIYVAGFFDQRTDFDPGPDFHYLKPAGYTDIFYAKYDSSGNYLFAHNIGAADTYNSANNITLNHEGNIILSGGLYGNIDFDPGPKTFLLSSGVHGGSYIAAYKNDGLFLNAFAITSTSTDLYSFDLSSLVVDNSDNIYIAGFFFGKVDFDPKKKKVYLPIDRGICLASYTKQGTLRFAEGSYASLSETTSFRDIALDKAGNIYATGTFSQQQLDLDLGPDSAILINKNYVAFYENTLDLFLAKYDNLGNYVYGYDFSGDSIIGYNSATSIDVDKNGNIYYIGDCETKIDFDPSQDSVFLQPSDGDNNLFIARYSPLAATRQTNKTTHPNVTKNVLTPGKESNLSVYPNPVSGHIVITVNNIKEPTGTAQALVYNATGSCVLKKELAISNHSIHSVIYVSALPKGAYFVTITASDEPYKASFVVQ